MEGVESIWLLDPLQTWTASVLLTFFVLFAETTVRKIWFVETLPFQDGYGKELRISSLSQTRLRPYEMPFEESVTESVYCPKWGADSGTRMVQ